MAYLDISGKSKEQQENSDDAEKNDSLKICPWAKSSNRKSDSSNLRHIINAHQQPKDPHTSPSLLYLEMQSLVPNPIISKRT